MTLRVDKSIGIFDSGIGGLTVLKEIIHRLPQEDTVYLGDTARVPYGTKSPETVTRYSFENASFLVKQEIKLLVVACNTSSAISLKEIEKALPIPVIGVLEPGARAAVKATKSKRVGVIGTEATIGSWAYPEAIKRLDHGIEVISTPCSLFVPLVEEGWTDNDVASSIAGIYLEPLKKEKIDTLVLGCTHYPLLKGIIKRIMGDSINLIDSAQETAIEVEKILLEKDLLKKASTEGKHRYFVTDAPGRFASLGERFLGFRIDDVEKINT
jgi:glutamate racemase